MPSFDHRFRATRSLADQADVAFRPAGDVAPRLEIERICSRSPGTLTTFTAPPRPGHPCSGRWVAPAQGRPPRSVHDRAGRKILTHRLPPGPSSMRPSPAHLSKPGQLVLQRPASSSKPTAAARCRDVRRGPWAGLDEGRGRGLASSSDAIARPAWARFLCWPAGR